MEKNPEVGFSFHDVNKVTDGGQFIENLLPENFKRNYSIAEIQSFQFAYIHANSVFWRKSQSEWPPELFCCTNNLDMFMPYIWSQSGTGKYQSNILPSNYRQTSNGIWSSKPEKTKLAQKLQVSLLMMSLHLRYGRLDQANNILGSRLVPNVHRLFNVG